MHDSERSSAEDEHQTFVEGLDFYFDEGLMVLTRRYLAARGYCCDKCCRHCPYNEPKLTTLQ